MFSFSYDVEVTVIRGAFEGLYGFIPGLVSEWIGSFLCFGGLMTAY